MLKFRDRLCLGWWLSPWTLIIISRKLRISEHKRNDIISGVLQSDFPTRGWIIIVAAVLQTGDFLRTHEFMSWRCAIVADNCSESCRIR